MRGELSYIKYNKANNKYLKPHDEDEPSKCITYEDTNIFMYKEFLNIFLLLDLSG